MDQSRAKTAGTGDGQRRAPAAAAPARPPTHPPERPLGVDHQEQAVAPGGEHVVLQRGGAVICAGGRGGQGSEKCCVSKR